MHLGRFVRVVVLVVVVEPLIPHGRIDFDDDDDDEDGPVGSWEGWLIVWRAF